MPGILEIPIDEVVSGKSAKPREIPIGEIEHAADIPDDLKPGVGLPGMPATPELTEVATPGRVVEDLGSGLRRGFLGTFDSLHSLANRMSGGDDRLADLASKLHGIPVEEAKKQNREVSKGIFDYIAPPPRPGPASTFGQALGSAGGFIAAAPLGLPAELAVGGGMGAEEALGRLDESGVKVSDSERAAVVAGGLALGLTESLPFERLFSKIAKLGGVIAKDATEETLKKALYPSIKEYAKIVGGQILEEGGQEAVQSLGQDALEVGYGARKPGEIGQTAVDEFAAGGAVGGLMALLGLAVGSRAGRARLRSVGIDPESVRQAAQEVDQEDVKAAPTEPKGKVKRERRKAPVVETPVEPQPETPDTSGIANADEAAPAEIPVDEIEVTEAPAASEEKEVIQPASEAKPEVAGEPEVKESKQVEEKTQPKRSQNAAETQPIDRAETLKPEVAETLQVGATRVNPKGGVETLTEIPIAKIRPAAPTEERPEGNVLYPDRVQEYVDNPSPLAVEVRSAEDGNFDTYEGHHRIEAAKQRGEETIKAWVSEPGEDGLPKVPAKPEMLPEEAVSLSDDDLQARAAKGEKVAQAEINRRLIEDKETREREETPREFHSTQVNLPKAMAERSIAVAKTIPKEALTEKGIEEQPHITVKYGLEDPADAAAVEKALVGAGPIRAKIGKTSIFETEDADVVKLDIESEDLHRLNKLIKEALPTRNDPHPDYVPHITLAYVKKGEGQKYAGRAIKGLTGETIDFDTLTFSSKDDEQTDIKLQGGKTRETSGKDPGQIGKSSKNEQNANTPEWAKPPKTATKILKVVKGDGVEAHLAQLTDGYSVTIMDSEEQKAIGEPRIYKTLPEAEAAFEKATAETKASEPKHDEKLSETSDQRIDRMFGEEPEWYQDIPGKKAPWATVVDAYKKYKAKGEGRNQHIKDFAQDFNEGVGDAAWYKPEPETPKAETKEAPAETPKPKQSAAERFAAYAKQQAEEAEQQLRDMGFYDSLKTGLPPEAIVPLTKIGMNFMAQGILKLDRWKGAMIAKLGAKIEPFLDMLYGKTQDLYEVELAKVYAEVNGEPEAAKQPAENSDIVKTPVEEQQDAAEPTGEEGEGTEPTVPGERTGAPDSETLAGEPAEDDAGPREEPQAAPGGEGSSAEDSADVRGPEGGRPEPGASGGGRVPGMVPPTNRAGSAKSDVRSGDSPGTGLAGDYRLSPEQAAERESGGARTKAKNNIAAIRAIKNIQAEGNRPATPEEQEAIAKYVGWGSGELANGLLGPRGPKADVRTRRQLNLPVPAIKTGGPQDVTAPPSEALKAYIEDIGRRADAIRGGMVKPDQDNMLKLSSDARKASLDMRLVDPLAKEDPNSKVNKAISNIVKIYQDFAQHKATQLVFLDLSTPKSDKVKKKRGTADEIANVDEVVEDTEEEIDPLADESEEDEEAEEEAETADEATERFTVYAQIRESLIRKGVKPEEIAFIHDAKTDEQKKDLFDRVNSGEVRVLLGSTEKMGAGMNVQERLIALHHLDSPWRPSDMEQREGRIIRQGNKLWAEQKIPVEIYRYSTEGSFDAFMWETIVSKALPIESFMDGDPSMDTIEELSPVVLSYEQAKAGASGNAEVREKILLDQDVMKLSVARGSWITQQSTARSLLAKLPGETKAQEEKISNLEKDIATKDADKTLKVDGKDYEAEAIRKEGAQALVEMLKAKGDIDKESPLNATYRGFSLVAIPTTRYEQVLVSPTGDIYRDVKQGDRVLYQKAADIEHTRNVLHEGDIKWSNLPKSDAEKLHHLVTAKDAWKDSNYEVRSLNLWDKPNISMRAAAHSYLVNVNYDAPAGTIASADNHIRDFERELKESKEQLGRYEREKIELEGKIGVPFKDEEKLAKMKERQKELEKKLGGTKDDAQALAADEETVDPDDPLSVLKAEPNPALAAKWFPKRKYFVTKLGKKESVSGNAINEYLAVRKAGRGDFEWQVEHMPTGMIIREDVNEPTAMASARAMANSGVNWNFTDYNAVPQEERKSNAEKIRTARESVVLPAETPEQAYARVKEGIDKRKAEQQAALEKNRKTGQKGAVSIDEETARNIRATGENVKHFGQLLRDQFIIPARQVIANQGKAGKKLAALIDKAFDKGEVEAGKLLSRLIDAELNKLTEEQRDSLLDNLEGRSDEADDQVEQAYQVVRAVLDELGAKAEDLGVMVGYTRTVWPGEDISGLDLSASEQKQLEAGKPVRVRGKKAFMARLDYFPHVIPDTEVLQRGVTPHPIRQDIIRNMVRTGAAADEKTAAAFIDAYVLFIKEGGRSEQIQKYLMDSGQANSEEEAFAMLQKFRKQRKVTRVGNLEYERDVNLPIYDPNPARVLPAAIVKSALRQTQIQMLGQNNQRVIRLARQIEKAGDDAQLALKAVDAIMGLANKGNDHEQKISRYFRSYQAMKLTLAAIPNSVQGFLNSWLRSDLPTAVQAAYETSKPVAAAIAEKLHVNLDPKTKANLLAPKRLAIKSGATLEATVSDTLRHGGIESSLLDKYLTAVGFTLTERMNRTLAANAGAIYAGKMLANLKANPKNSRAADMLRELGIDPKAALAAGKLSGDDVLMAAKKFSDVTQFRSRPQDLPLFSATPSGKVFFQFKNYIYGQTRLLNKEIIGELKAGRPGRALRSLLVLGIVFPMTGELIRFLRDVAMGRDPDRDDEELLERYLNDIGQTGALGVLTEIAQSSSIQGGVTRWMVGPTISDLGETAEKIVNPKDTPAYKRWWIRKIPMLGPVLAERIYPK